MQYGNALKDSGSYSDADRIYLQALDLRPTDADIFLQRGHLMKLAGDLASAEGLYRQAVRLDPTLAAAQFEIDELNAKSTGERAKSATRDAEQAWIVLRTHVPMSASIILHRITNQYRWRHG